MDRDPCSDGVAGDASRPGAMRLDALTALRVALAFEDPKVGARLRSLPSRLPDLPTALKDAVSNVPVCRSTGKYQ